MTAGDRIVFGKTRTGPLVGWIPDPAGAPVDTRVLITKTRDGSLVGWPRSASGPAADTRVLIARADAGDLVAWALTRPAGGCPDVSAYSPVDKSFSDDFTLVAGGSGNLNYRYPAGITPHSTGYYQIPSGRAWCVSDVHLKLTWLTGSGIGPDINLVLDNQYSFFMRGPVWAPGDVIDVTWPGMFALLTQSNRVSYWADATGSSGTARFEASWTATEFDLANQL